MSSPWWQLYSAGGLGLALFFASEGHGAWLICYGSVVFATYSRKIEQ